MRLRNIDKFIKDKLQGYKPAYQEDLWKAIEEKLPPSRVPNGNGSWLIAAAAAVLILALVPAMLKFNSLADKRYEMAQATKEMPKTPNGNAITVVPGSPAQNNPESSFEQGKTNTPTADAGSSAKADNSSLLSNSAPFDNHGTNHSVSLASNHGSKINWHANKKHNTNNTTVSLSADNDNTTEPVQTKEKALAQLLDNNNASGVMNAISLGVALPDENAEALEIKGSTGNAEVGRYANRGANNKYARWDNWQSIFYAFWQNPAYTGSEGKFNFTFDDKIDYDNNNSALNYHNNFAFDTRFDGPGLGVGVYHSRDLTPYSLQSTTGLALSKTLLRKGATTVKLGVAGTVINNSLFFNALNYPDQIDPILGIKYATKEKDPVAMTQAFGLNAGIWVSNNHIMAGMDVENLNKPHLEHISEAAPLPRLWRATFGYRFSPDRDVQIMPMAVVTRKNDVNQANATLTAVYKNTFMASVAYQNISPTTGRGNLLYYIGADIKKQARVFASYGYNLELAEIGVKEQFVHIGIKIQVP